MLLNPSVTKFCLLFLGSDLFVCNDINSKSLVCSLNVLGKVIHFTFADRSTLISWLLRFNFHSLLWKTIYINEPIALQKVLFVSLQIMTENIIWHTVDRAPCVRKCDP